MRTLLVTTMCVLCVGGVALGDWDEGDGHKMHHPQLPDPNGWDVNFVDPKILADDWQCSRTGPVSDIHFWMSSRNDEMPLLEGIHVSIHENIPAGGTGQNFSMPGAELWARDLGTGFTIRKWHEEGPQGWYDPNSGETVFPGPPGDHRFIWQVNIEQIQDPFPQTFGEIYWLDLMVYPAELGTSPVYGWKTTTADLAFMDIAVWADVGGPWTPVIIDSSTPVDFAFVITPEPATMSLLVLGGLVALRRRRRR